MIPHSCATFRPFETFRSYFILSLWCYLVSAILTVESNTGLKPVYFFTFVSNPSPMLPLAYMAVIPLLKHTYISDENVLLVWLKEKEAISWSEITTHFLGRNMSSLQVHYSTKLRHTASSRSRRPRRRE
ncbi:hypothetical protein N7527_002441 [Penicillium freii]|nr:hypothetical protein N7527_002441 [Penicillium freii]